MRVLLVVHGFPPSGSGGSEIYTEELALTLRDHCGDEVFVLAREADSDRPEYALRSENRHGLQVHFINNTFAGIESYEESYRNPAVRDVCARLIDRIRPDIAHIHHLTCLSTDLVLELAGRRIPVLYTLHDYWLMCHRGQLFDTNLERCAGPDRGCARCIGPAGGAGSGAFTLARGTRRLPAPVTRLARRLATLTMGASSAGGSEEAARRRSTHMLEICEHVSLFLAPSEAVRERFLAFGVTADKVLPTQLGIDRTPFADLRRTGGARLRVGFLGSLMPSKAPHLLLEAFAGLPANTATLTLCGGHVPYHGDDSYRERLAPLLAQPGVVHHGPVPHRQVPELLASIDVAVMPSLWLENSPLVIREAFLAGVPVVAANLGGMAEMVEHGVSGLLFEPGSAADLGRALQRLIDEPALLDRLRAGIPPVRPIEDDAMSLREIYARLVEAAPQPPRLAAVVLNYRTAEETVLAVRSLQSSRRRVDHLIVIDNGSDDGSEELLRARLCGVDLVQTGANLGFSGGCNAGVRRALDAGADLVLLLNSDAMVTAHTLGRLEAALGSRASAGIAAPVVLDRRDPSCVATAGMAFNRRTGRMRHPDLGLGFAAEHPLDTRDVDGVSGCAMLVRREVFEHVGLFDEDYFFSFEDLDLCLRAAAAGWSTIRVGDAVAYHAGSRSMGPRSTDRLYYAARNHLLVARRGAPTGPLLAFPRMALIVGLNVTHAVLSRGPRRIHGVIRVLRGVVDFLRGRLGQVIGSD